MDHTCSAKRGKHVGQMDEYYCTDGELVVLCQRHLKACKVVVWDWNDETHKRVPISKSYDDDVYHWKTEYARVRIPALSQRISYPDYFRCYQRACAAQAPKRFPVRIREELQMVARIAARFAKACPKEWRTKFAADVQHDLRRIAEALRRIAALHRKIDAGRRRAR